MKFTFFVTDVESLTYSKKCSRYISATHIGVCDLIGRDSADCGCELFSSKTNDDDEIESSFGEVDKRPFEAEGNNRIGSVGDVGDFCQ